MRFTAVALFVACALSSVAQAQPQTDYWFVVASTNNGRAYSAAYIDTTRISQRGPYLRAWVELQFAANAPGVMARYSQAAMLTEFDCEQRRSRVLQMTSYYRSDGSPNTTTETSNWQFETPRTAGETTLLFVCASAAERLNNANYVQLDGMSVAEAAEILIDVQR